MAELLSDGSAPADGTLETGDWWLSIVGDPDSLVPASVPPGWEPSTHREVGVFYPVGGDPDDVHRAVVVRGDTYGIVTTLAAQALDQATYDLVRAALLADATLLLRSSMGQQWYLAVTGDVTEHQLRAQPTPGEPWPLRWAFTLDAPVVEVQEP